MARKAFFEKDFSNSFGVLPQTPPKGHNPLESHDSFSEIGQPQADRFPKSRTKVFGESGENPFLKKGVFTTKKLFLFFLIFQCFPVLGCLNFAHEWTVIATGTYDSTGNVFALSNAFFQFKEEFGKQSSSKNHASETISVAGVFWGEKSEPASGDQIDCFQRAINLSWGPDRIIIDPGKILMTDDSEKFLEAARNGKTPLSATVHVKKFASDQLVLLDLIFFNWALLRTVFREELTMTVQVVDRAGDLVFLDEFNVSPTILTDTMLSPSGNYLTYFEKHDCQPWILDFGELFQNVASSTYSARSQMFRMPDIPSSIPMASPLFKDAPPEKQ